MNKDNEQAHQARLREMQSACDNAKTPQEFGLAFAQMFSACIHRVLDRIDERENVTKHLA